MRIYNFFDNDLRAISDAVEKLKSTRRAFKDPKDAGRRHRAVQGVKNQFQLFLQTQPSPESTTW